MSFDENYYSNNGQSGDRPALLFYERIWRCYVGVGPTLDFGCGTGAFLSRLSRYTKVCGVEGAEYARNSCLRLLPSVKVARTTKEFASASFTAVTALHVLEHIDDEGLQWLGSEFNRLLLPRGRAMVVMPNKHGSAHHLKGEKWSAFTDPTHINLKSADEWKQLFTETWGFRLVFEFADGYYDFPYVQRSVRGLAGDFVRATKTAVQFVLARPILLPGDGENVVFIIEKKT